MQFFDTRLPDRFWRKVQPCPISGCWLWTGAICRDGYGSIYVDGHFPGAHKVAYLAARGPVPDGLVLDHRCRLRCCVNPDHLEAVTEQINILRGESPAARHAQKTECINGHPLDERNVRIDRNTRGGPKRVCRKCDAAAHRRATARKRGAA